MKQPVVHPSFRVPGRLRARASRKTNGIAIALSLLGVALYAPSARANPSWEPVALDAGIQVWERDVPGTSFVAFRAHGAVNAPIMAVAAVLRDIERYPEWAKNCSHGLTLAYKKATQLVAYVRTESPAFFIRDRDVVIDIDLESSQPGQTLAFTFTSTTHKAMPPQDGVERMPRLTGYWRLTKIGSHMTRVEYQIQADPGGSLPAWLVNWASRKIPMDSVKGLRKQVRKEGYDKHRLILERALRWPSPETAEITSDQTP